MIIQWSPRAVRDLRRLSKRAEDLVVSKVNQYAENPASLANQVRALTGSNQRRLRVGNYRLVFVVIRGQTRILRVVRVRHRSEAYD
jgi:mRNA interferase RelE/StbE